MLKNRIIPCLDVKNGRVVKGINFVELKETETTTPLYGKVEKFQIKDLHSI